MKILLVDDDIFFQNFYSNKLREDGFEVEVSGNGDDALAKTKASPPNLVLLDMIMPIKDGFDYLEGIAQQPSKPPIIVFSTLGDQADIDKAIRLGAVDYVNKGLADYASLKEKVTKYTTQT